jgi:hypothetical protein
LAYKCPSWRDSRRQFPRSRARKSSHLSHCRAERVEFLVHWGLLTFTSTFLAPPQDDRISGTPLAVSSREEQLIMRAALASALVVFAVGLTASVAASGRDLTIPAGTALRVKLDNSVGSDSSRVEDTVRGRLISPIVIDGRTVVPAGSAVLGSVTQAVQSGKVKGRARLGLRFHTLTATGSERYRISTRPWLGVAPATKTKDAETIAVPAAGGAIVGALIGGKKGAAIGAAAGGGGGTAVVLSTRGREVRLGPGAVVLVRLTAPLSVHVSS